MLLEMNDWLAGRLEGHGFRIDTYQGQPDVTVFYSKQTPEAIYNQGTWAAASLQKEVHEAGFSSSSEKMLLLYVDSPMKSTRHGGILCGAAHRPPEKPGNVRIINVYDQACQWRSPTGFLWLSGTAAHEAAHLAGAVPRDAPAFDGHGHSTERQDKMYGQSVSLSERESQLVDQGRDDYFHLVAPYLAPTHLPVAVRVNGNGQVNFDTAANRYLGSKTNTCENACEHWFRIGQKVRAEAQPLDNTYRFKNWGGACLDAAGCEIVIDGHKELQAFFEPMVNVDVRVRGPGVVHGLGKACTSNVLVCEYQLPPGGRANLVAKPARGGRFVRWAGACAAAKAKVNCSLPLRHGYDRKVTAVFGRQPRR
jgi:hypothetical protein